MSLTPVLCEICGKNAHCYRVEFPRKNPKQCDKCHTYLEARTEIHNFCSWNCLKLFVAKKNETKE